MSIKKQIGLIAVLSLALGGCAGSSTEDLEDFVKNAHTDTKPRVEPIPDVKTAETFIYSASNLTDPFTAFNLKPTGAKAGGPRPDPNRRKEALEEYPLDSLRMVGTLMRGKQAWAVIQAPDGTVHRASVGNHLGQNFGMITRITDDKVFIIELIQGAIGDWVEREAGLALAGE
jgi:type IV pilus assembly protein PilP